MAPITEPGLLLLELGVGQDAVRSQVSQLLQLRDDVVTSPLPPPAVRAWRLVLLRVLRSAGSEYVSWPAHRLAWRRDTRLDTAVAVPATTAVRAIPPIRPMFLSFSW